MSFLNKRPERSALAYGAILTLSHHGSGVGVSWRMAPLMESFFFIRVATRPSTRLTRRRKAVSEVSLLVSGH